MNQDFSNDQEIWKDIEGYEGLYQVSNMGRVKSLNYNRTGTERVLKGVKNKYGYLQVALCKDGKIKIHKVHRLVAEAFIPNPYSLPCINHINENKEENRVSNLEFCTYSYNNTYGSRIERMVKKSSKPVLQLTLDGKLVREWPSAHEAQRQGGFSQGHVAACCRGERNKHKEYRWAYKEVS